MTTTPVRTGTHACDLPALPGRYSNGDVVRCEICRRYWQAWVAPYFEWAADWRALSRFAGWRIARRSRKGH